MKKLEVNINSVIDVITNSSTYIFVYAGSNSIDIIKEIIDTILNVGGSKKKADDLFNISLVPSDIDELLENIAENYAEYSEDSCPTLKDLNVLDREEQDTILIRLLKKNFTEDQIIESCMDKEIDIDICIECKEENVEADASFKLINQLFSSAESSNY